MRGAAPLVPFLPVTVSVRMGGRPLETVRRMGMWPERARRGIVGFTLVAVLGLPRLAAAGEDIEGVITARGSDRTVAVQTDEANLIVIMDDRTKVRRTDGMRVRTMSSAALIPGLRVKVDGRYETPTRFLAERVSFSRSDLIMAQAIRGGVAPTDERSLVNEQRILDNAKVIQRQQQTLGVQALEIAANNAQIKANDEKIRANDEKIAAAAGALEEKIVATSGTLETRIANLDNFDAVRTVTVYFRNGLATIEPEDRATLQQLALDAHAVPGFMIQVQGHASDVGSKAENQVLSQRRADAVTALLHQSGVPASNIFAPAAMGVSVQVASNDTSKGQAENRRTVVTLLQNKGISAR
jgi:outer membrane protein OmpA-like peptidoglycan-associated protein